MDSLTCEKCNKEYDDIYGSCYICGTKPVKKKGGFKSFLIGLFSFFIAVLFSYLTALLFGLIIEDIMLDNPVFIQIIIYSSFFDLTNLMLYFANFLSVKSGAASATLASSNVNTLGTPGKGSPGKYVGEYGT